MFSFRVLIVLCSAALVCAYVLYRGDALPWSSPRPEGLVPLDGTPTVMPGSKFERAFTPPAEPPQSESVMSGSKSAAISVPGDFQPPPVITLPPATTKPAEQQPKP